MTNCSRCKENKAMLCVSCANEIQDEGVADLVAALQWALEWAAPPMRSWYVGDEDFFVSLKGWQRQYREARAAASTEEAFRQAVHLPALPSDDTAGYLPALPNDDTAVRIIELISAMDDQTRDVLYTVAMGLMALQRDRYTPTPPHPAEPVAQTES